MSKSSNVILPHDSIATAYGKAERAYQGLMRWWKPGQPLPAGAQQAANLMESYALALANKSKIKD